MCRSILGEAGVELAKGIGIGRILVARAVPSRDILSQLDGGDAGARRRAINSFVPPTCPSESPMLVSRS